MTTRIAFRAKAVFNAVLFSNYPYNAYFTTYASWQDAALLVNKD